MFGREERSGLLTRIFAKSKDGLLRTDETKPGADVKMWKTLLFCFAVPFFAMFVIYAGLLGFEIDPAKLDEVSRRFLIAKISMEW